MQEVPGSNPGGPTKEIKDLPPVPSLKALVSGPVQVQTGPKLLAGSCGVMPHSMTPEATCSIESAWGAWDRWGHVFAFCLLVPGSGEEKIAPLYGWPHDPHGPARLVSSPAWRAMPSTGGGRQKPHHDASASVVSTQARRRALRARIARQWQVLRESRMTFQTMRGRNDFSNDFSLDD